MKGGLDMETTHGNTGAAGGGDMPLPPAPEGVPTCRVCGCWEYGACWDEDLGACWWVEGDLCSHCVEA